MFIAHRDFLVKPFLSAEAYAGILPAAGMQMVRDLLDLPRAHTSYFTARDDKIDLPRHLAASFLDEITCSS